MDRPDKSETRLARVLDAIAYGILATTVIFAHPRLGTTPLGDLGNLHLLPLTGIVAATFLVPLQAVGTERWQNTVWRLRTSALIAFCLAPFISWWLRSIDNLYLLLSGAMAMYAGIWYSMDLALLTRELCRYCNRDDLATDAGITRGLLFYLVFIPTLGVHVSFLAAVFAFPGTMPGDLHRTWRLVPVLIRYLMLLAVLNLAWMLWRSHRVVLDQMPEPGTGTDDAPNKGGTDDLQRITLD